jgi:hypothetical protein
MSMRLRILRMPNPPGSAFPEYQISSIDFPSDWPNYASGGTLHTRALAMGASASALESLEKRAAALNVGEWFDIEELSS